MKKSRNIFAFTLIELVIVIGIISILASITIIFINPAQIYSTTRDARRTQDLSTIRGTLERYFIDSNNKGQVATFSALNGYSAMVSNATSVSGATSICPNATNFASVINPFNLSSGTGATILSLDNLINGGYLPGPLTDPTGVAYKACIDPCNNQQIVIYSNVIENGSNNINVPLGTLGASAAAAVQYPCMVQSATADVSTLSYPYCVGNSVSVIMAASPVVGNLIVVTAFNNNGGFYPAFIASVTDSAGNGSYTKANQTQSGAYQPSMNVWYKKLTSTATNFTITANPQYVNAQNCSSIVVQEYKGVALGVLDQVSNSSVGMGFGFCNGSVSSGFTPTTTQNTELLVGSMGLRPNTSGAVAITPGSGYSTRTNLTSNYQSTIIYSQDKVASSTATYDSSLSVNYPDCAFSTMISTFK